MYVYESARGVLYIVYALNGISQSERDPRELTQALFRATARQQSAEMLLREGRRGNVRHTGAREESRRRCASREDVLLQYGREEILFTLGVCTAIDELLVFLRECCVQEVLGWKA